jgi:hypothetical protein
MTKTFRAATMLGATLALFPLLPGCMDDTVSTPPSPPPGPSGGSASSEPGAPGLKQIMTKLAKGPNSLTPVIGEALKADKPDWDKIQPQAKEYANLSAEMAKYDPPKGSHDSWIKLCAAYSETAAGLDKAAQAKDKPAALASHGELSNSCKSCHEQHRVMGPGGPGRGGPPGGGPQGGPGGPPPKGGPPK